ncbi:hypothetical protein MHH33_11230 [Paenisporosarcina sp. FSL H8-0542]
MHLLSQEGCLNAGATIDEIMKTLKIGVIGGGSIKKKLKPISMIYR